jgi:hypothetical protein
MAKGRDWIDQECERWAIIWREVNGLSDPRTAGGFLGALHCTLGARRDLHAGSSTNYRDQHWPEVFVGRSVVVNRAFHSMDPSLREIMVANYVIREPKNRTIRADLMGLSRKAYFDRLGRVKCYVEGALSSVENVYTNTGHPRGI